MITQSSTIRVDRFSDRKAGHPNLPAAQTILGTIIGDSKMKKCCHCKKIKSLEKFSKNRSTKDGYQSYCKVCARKLRKTEKGKESHRICNNRYRNKYRLKHQAKLAVCYAIKTGKIVCAKYKKCVCGEQARHHHHDSYEPEYWLDVIALCELCHHKLHLKKAANRS